MNEYFCSVSSLNDDNCILPVFESRCPNKISNIACTPDEIQSLIEILNPNKASGPDGISNKMLKLVAKEVSVPLNILFNRSFREGKFPEYWKHSNLIPIPKKGDNSDPSNFRPVSLLCSVGKLQECIIFRHIHNFLIENDLIINISLDFYQNTQLLFKAMYRYNPHGDYNSSAILIPLKLIIYSIFMMIRVTQTLEFYEK